MSGASPLMQIGRVRVGPGEPVYVIAELGVNHDGSVERALELVDASADAGANAIKLQLFEADRLMSSAARLAAYQKAAGEHDPIAMLRRLELSIEQMAPIVARAHARGVHAIVTVFSLELVEHAERLPFDAYKTASPDIVHWPLLDRLAETGKPMIVSTGASTIDEVANAVERLAPVHGRLALLQCVSSYPTPDDRACLGGIVDLSQRFPHVPIGYSDHAASERIGSRAVALGACMLERHLTYSKRAVGPDHAASSEPADLAAYIRAARATRFDAALAERSREPKQVIDLERDVRTVSRQSLTTTRPLRAGHRLTRSDITFKRPGTGLGPLHVSSVLGRALARDVDADMPIMEHDLGAA